MFLHRTRLGRIVYDRKKHVYTVRDIIRILLAVSGRDIDAAMRNLFGIVGDIVADWILKYRKNLVNLAVEIIATVWQKIIQPLLEIAGKNLTWFVELIGYVPPPPPPPPQIPT